MALLRPGFVEDSREPGSKMLAIGTDITEISRVKQLIERHGDFCKGRIFTNCEWDYCMGKSNPYPSFAVRFAAKEAVSKAFGVGMGSLFRWTSAEVRCDVKGAPYVVLDALGQKLLQQFYASKVHISLSHSRKYALAVVFFE